MPLPLYPSPVRIALYVECTEADGTVFRQIHDYPAAENVVMSTDSGVDFDPFTGRIGQVRPRHITIDFDTAGASYIYMPPERWSPPANPDQPALQAGTKEVEP